MQKNHELKHYRIGDFARYLGITADYLKHYEDQGLLSVRQREGGYRYYPFDQSARIIEYMRLRNYGVTVKEMNGMLATNAAEAFEQLDRKAAELEVQAERLQGLVEEHRRLRQWYAARRENPVDWEVRDMPPYWFLPHTSSQDFLRDKRIGELFKAWSAWTPVTKSAMTVGHDAAEGEEALHWGLAVPAAIAEKHRLPDNGVVERIEFGKAFVYHFCDLERAFSMEDIRRGEHPAFRLLHELGFFVRGKALLINEMRLTDDDGLCTAGVGRFIIPVGRREAP